jgi:hypothetical protein
VVRSIPETISARRLTEPPLTPPLPTRGTRFSCARRVFPITGAGSDLMQFDEIARGIFEENLSRLGSYQCINDPVRHVHTVQFGAGLLNIFHCKRHMKSCGILLAVYRPGRRRSIAADDVNLRGGLSLFANIHPRARHERNFRPRHVRSQAEDLGVEAVRIRHFVLRNAQSVVVKFDDADCHLSIETESQKHVAGPSNDATIAGRDVEHSADDDRTR